MRLYMILCAVLFVAACARPSMEGTQQEYEDGGAYIECSHHIDCEISEVCENQVCVSIPEEETIDNNCVDTNDCPFGMFCDLGIALCVDCLVDDHCDLGFTCTDGVCFEIPVEEPESGMCQEDSECPMGYTCIEGECIPIQNQGVSCTSQDDCDIYGRVCLDGECVPCDDDILCPSNLVCSAGICTDPGNGTDPGVGDACLSYVDCPDYIACDWVMMQCFSCNHDDQCNTLFDMIYAPPAWCCYESDVASGFCNIPGRCMPF